MTQHDQHLKSHQQCSLRHRQFAASQRGFTLVELLVAIAIFALLSALGWQVLDHLMRIQARNTQHEQVVEGLQNAYLQLQRDSLQVVPLSASVSDQKQAAVYLNRQVLSLSKTGVSDPLNRGDAPEERIEYVYNSDEKRLYRLKYRYLDRLQSEQPLSSVLLDGVDEFEMLVLHPEERSQWPAAYVHPNDLNALKAIPKGIKFKFKIQDVEYEWIFSLNSQDLQSLSLRQYRQQRSPISQLQPVTDPVPTTAAQFSVEYAV